MKETRKVQYLGSQFLLNLPSAIVKAMAIKKGDQLIYRTDDTYSYLVVVKKIIYDTSPYTRNKIDEFLAEEVI